MLQWTLSIYLGSADDGGQGGQGGAGGAAGDHRLQADPGRAEEAGLLYSGRCTVQVYCTGTCTARRTCWSWRPASARPSSTGRPSPGAWAEERCPSCCSHSGQRARHRDIAGGAFCLSVMDFSNSRLGLWVFVLVLLDINELPAYEPPEARLLVARRWTRRCWRGCCAGAPARGCGGCPTCSSTPTCGGCCPPAAPPPPRSPRCSCHPRTPGNYRDI